MNEPLPPLPPTLTVKLPSGLSLEEFLAKDWGSGDGLRYEWCEGRVEAGEESMKLNEIGMVARITSRFRESPAGSAGAHLLQEVEFFLRGGRSYRRADLSAFRAEEISAAERGAKVVPSFVIEIISPNDLAFHVERKLAEYFESGVKAVWYVHPELGLVRVYRSRSEAQACTGDDLCSAAPAFPDFQMTVKDLLSPAGAPA